MDCLNLSNFPLFNINPLFVIPSTSSLSLEGILLDLCFLSNCNAKFTSTSNTVIFRSFNFLTSQTSAFKVVLFSFLTNCLISTEHTVLKLNIHVLNSLGWLLLKSSNVETATSWSRSHEPFGSKQRSVFSPANYSTQQDTLHVKFFTSTPCPCINSEEQQNYLLCSVLQSTFHLTLPSPVMMICLCP